MSPSRSPRFNRWPIPVWALIHLLAASSVAIGGTYVEEFDTTTRRDATATTADWNTAVGKLQLHPYQLRPLGNSGGVHEGHPGFGRQVQVIGSIAYVPLSNNSDGGLLTFDISDPANPTLLSYFHSGPAFGVDVVGDRAYLANHFAGLRILDVSDPTNPVEIGIYDTPDAARDVVVRGHLAYVADGFSADVAFPNSAGLQIIDVSNPAAPTLVGSCQTPGIGSGTSNAQGIDLQGHYAYVACFDAGLRIIDVSDPANPAIVGILDPPGTARQVGIRMCPGS